MEIYPRDDGSGRTAQHPSGVWLYITLLRNSHKKTDFDFAHRREAKSWEICLSWMTKHGWWSYLYLVTNNRVKTKFCLQVRIQNWKWEASWKQLVTLWPTYLFTNAAVSRNLVPEPDRVSCGSTDTVAVTDPPDKPFLTAGSTRSTAVANFALPPKRTVEPGLYVGVWTGRCAVIYRVPKVIVTCVACRWWRCSLLCVFSSVLIHFHVPSSWLGLAASHNALPAPSPYLNVIARN